MINVLLAVTNLADLGVQHDVRTLMQHWDTQTFNVKMLLHSRDGNFADQFPKTMQSVQVDDYVTKIPKLRVLARLHGYKKIIDMEKPDVVISFVPFCNYGCIWAKFWSKHRFGLAISEHAHVSAATQDLANMSNVFMKVYRWTFRWLYNSSLANVVKCIAEESRDDLIQNHRIQSEKTALIYNPVPMDEIKERALEPVDHPWFHTSQRHIPILINVGRLCYQKQQDLLIKAFAHVKKTLDCRLVLVGSGNQKPLVRLSEKLGVRNDVHFVGFDPNPWRWMARSDLFVLSSIWEGLPCVLTESMVLNLPIVSTRCPSGPFEMLLQGQAGYLCDVGKVYSLAETICYALTHREETLQKVEVARANLSRFHPMHVTKQYQELALQLAGIVTDS